MVPHRTDRRTDAGRGAMFIIEEAKESAARRKREEKPAGWLGLQPELLTSIGYVAVRLGLLWGGARAAYMANQRW